MGGRSVSPGGALMRSSRMFSMPKPLPDRIGAAAGSYGANSQSSTKPYPQHQAITSPLASREKGDWGLKRSLPLKQTMGTTTPLVRIKQFDSVEKITDYSSAADHGLSLEKFKELRIAMSIPQDNQRLSLDGTSRQEQLKSVFEEDMDFTTTKKTGSHDKRWKFRGPWLARMTQGDFIKYLEKNVRPRRQEFKDLLRRDLAEQMTARQTQEARETGQPVPPKVTVGDISDETFTQHLRLLRNDRPILYALISKFLDLAPLGKPIGFSANSGLFFAEDTTPIVQSPYGSSGPPPSHPSAGISYLRTNAVMDNHPIYGPQAHRAPVLSRVISPRVGSKPAKLGVGGFVANVPAGDNDFNMRNTMSRSANRKQVNGISHLDINTFGGAKAYVEPHTATVNPDGKVVLKVRTTGAEAEVVAKEAAGSTTIYDDSKIERYIKPEQSRMTEAETSRMKALADEVLEEEEPEASSVLEKDIVGSSSSYGLKGPDSK